jgi:hypothetical protein
MQTLFPISVMVTDTWLAVASRRLTRDMPKLVTGVLDAVTRLLSVALASSLRAFSTS